MSTASDLHSITLVNTPLDDPTKMENAAELFRSIGLATSSWSRFEIHIDMVLIYLNRPRHSPVLYGKNHP